MAAANAIPAPGPRGALLGTLRGEGFELPLYELDAVTMARSVWGEEGARANSAQAQAITSTMLRRWVAVHAAAARRNGAPPNWPSLDILVAGTASQKGYSTPVSRPLPRTPHRIQSQDMPWAEIPAPIRDGVTALLTGSAPLTQPNSGAVHFAAGYLVREKMPRNPDWLLVQSPAANQLVSDATGRALPRDPIVERAAGPGLLLSTGLLCALSLWAVTR